MIFSSSLFIFAFCPLFFIAYFLVPLKLKNIVIIIGSLFFYAWGAHSFVLIILISCLADYKLGVVIKSAKDRTGKKTLYHACVVFDICINFALLLYFKYANFLIDNINSLFSLIRLSPIVMGNIILPIGISFVVFQKVTYCLDIAKGTAEPAQDFHSYVEYLLIFPQIIAGPIVKYNLLIPQIKKRMISKEDIFYGFRRFSIGIFKKVWIADVVAKYADIAFNGQAQAIPIHYAWIGVTCYTLQIYFDFSAYSDMAIGMLKIMNFEIPENFNNPYISKSITEFWKRWHISLTSWMREYLYIPLGGNRKGKLRTYFNQWIVFIISGLWHGASWNFVFWGIYHGTLICIEKALILKKTHKAPVFLRIIFTMLLVMVGWVFFRANRFDDALRYLQQMFNISSIRMHPDPNRIMVVDDRSVFTILLACFLCLLPSFKRINMAIAVINNKYKKIIFILCCILFLLATLKIGTASFSPFIYFRF
jgi:alginate O-acetyltransferase complex protein AlgI